MCALNRAPVLAAVQAVVATLIWRVRFGLALEPNDVDAFIANLRDARAAEEASPAMIRATLAPDFIAVPVQSRSAKRWIQTAIAFRDEMAADRWRNLKTALRHQPQPVVSSVPITRISRSRFAKLSDL